MQREWLKKKISIAEAEIQNMHSHPRIGPSPIAFGFQNARWRELVAKIRDSDELWTFSSGAESWKHLCGRGGIALVRNGEIVDSIVTVMN